MSPANCHCVLVAVFASVALAVGARRFTRVHVEHARAARDPQAVAAWRRACWRRLQLTEVREPLGQALPAGRAEVAEGNVEAAPPADGRRLSQPDGSGRCTAPPRRDLPFVVGGMPAAACSGSRTGTSRCSAPPSGYVLPSIWLGRKTALRQKQIRNGLPDALDLMIVCIEAGSGIDQAIVKTSDELDISYPALAEELRLITTEMRAGKPRLEAFKNFASRTKVDEVRSLVAMLVQTDRFGTSVAQALAHACGSVANQAPAERGRAGGEDRRQAGVPAGVLPVSGALRRHPRTGGGGLRSDVQAGHRRVNR